MLALLVLGGCKPKPAPGAYLCNPSDQGCPGELRCVCGQCVANEVQAACGFAVEPKPPATLHEYDPLPVTVRALTASGAPATGFGGKVDLSFELADGTRWSAVTPSQLVLAGGSATGTVALNRETIPPQAPHLVARTGAIRGDGPQLEVLSPPFVKDAAAVIPPTLTAPFAFADVTVFGPGVVAMPQGLNLYFGAASSTPEFSIAVLSLGTGCGTAAGPCAPDARLPAQRVLRPTTGTFYSMLVTTPAPLRVGGDLWMAFQAIDGSAATVGLARSADGISFEVVNNGNPILKSADCDSYCAPGQLFASSLVSVTPGELQLYFWTPPLGFSPDLGDSEPPVVIGRATSTDNMTFRPAPAPILNAEIGGENVPVGGRVLWDRGVYKMWYSYAKVYMGDCSAHWLIGYATSTDGLYWTRSPRNPVLVPGGAAWELDSMAVQVGSVLPLDGQNPANGLAMYYSPFPRNGSSCIANGIGRAVAGAR